MAIEPKHILYLLKRDFDPSKNTFGQGLISSGPLTFNQVNGGRAPVSKLLLSKIPFELQAMVFSYLDKQSWASLAYVDRDCRQLARSRQFRSILLDYSPACIRLLDHLIAESCSPRNSIEKDLATIEPSIGTCIRLIVVSTDPKWLSQYHAISSSVKPDKEDEIVRSIRLEGAILPYERYLKKIETLLSSKSALPNLQLLQWEEKILPSEMFLSNLLRSSIQHLKLHAYKVNHDFKFGLENFPNGLKLKTLCVDFEGTRYDKNLENMGLLCSNLLRNASENLESFVWRGCNEDAFAFIPYNHDANYLLSKLESLCIENVFIIGNLLQDALLQSPLVSICLCRISHYATTIQLNNRGHIPTLRSFLWKTDVFDNATELDKFFGFLNCNPQLNSLSILSEYSDEHTLKTRILPLLSSSFYQLTSLRLTWPARQIPTSALDSIYQIKSLRQLCLTVSTESYWRGKNQNWEINHNLMRNRLCELPQLQKVAFTNDTYDSQSKNYYDKKSKEADVSEFKEYHLKMIRKEVEQYAKLLPGLQWMYLGRAEIHISRTPYHTKEVLTDNWLQTGHDRVEKEWKLLSHIFGGELIEQWFD